MAHIQITDKLVRLKVLRLEERLSHLYVRFY